MGVCVGMQMLLDHRGAGHTGPGADPGQVRRFRLEGQLQPDGSRYKVPQMGWNQVRQAARRCRTRSGRVCPTASFYFVHSYYAEPPRTPQRRHHRLRLALYLRGGAG
jgi:glutamine amidotransferase